MNPAADRLGPQGRLRLHPLLEAIFREHLDTNVVWLPGTPPCAYDFTDGHVDAIARYTPAGEVLYDESNAV